jgi:hypothetical protein
VRRLRKGVVHPEAAQNRIPILSLEEGRPEMSKPRHAQFTSRPDIPAPLLKCPTCDRFLVYESTIFNGVNPLERWDMFKCATCGPFEYRHRTSKLRAVPQTA